MNTTEITSRLKRFNPWHGAFAALALGLFLFMAARAQNPDRWSDWGFGDAQTMLSLKQWDEGGWIDNYLLFIPQGYAKVIKFLDEPSLRQHAHGTCQGSSPRCGPRLWYTHYPAGYLVPFAALFELGLTSMQAARTLAVLLSIAGLGLMYAFFSRLIRPSVAFVACAVYGLAPVYLGYADSLANMAIDDLLRFGFMMALLFTTRAATEKGRRNATIAAWVIEFCLSLSSFDSVFFVFVWLLGWDLLEGQGFRWKRYLAFGMAPVTAHGLQFLQNVWYLGWADAVIDIKDTFLLKAGAAEVSRHQAFLMSVKIVFINIFHKQWLFWSLVGLYAVRRTLMRSPDDRPLPGLSLLTLLFLAGLAYVFVLPHGARMPYQGRQLLPFFAVALAGVAVAVGDTFATLARPSSEARSGFLRKVLDLPWLTAAVLGLFVFGIFFGFAKRDPVYSLDRFGPDVPLAKALQSVPTSREPVFFNLDGMRTYWNPAYMPGYPQILPLLEYYAGSRAILCFDYENNLVADLQQLLRLGGPGSFSPVLVASDPDRLKNLVELLRATGVIGSLPSGPWQVHGRYVLDLTPHLRQG